MTIKTAKSRNWFFTIAHSVSSYYANKEGALKWIMSLILVDNTSSIQLQHITLLLQHSQELLGCKWKRFIKTMNAIIFIFQGNWAKEYRPHTLGCLLEIEVRNVEFTLCFIWEICSQKKLNPIYHWIALPWPHLCISIHFFSPEIHVIENQ